MRMSIAAVAGMILLAPAQAHDSWISRGGIRNGAGEWCCGDGDCGFAVLDKAAESTIVAMEDGYHVNAVFVISYPGTTAVLKERYVEVVPYSEAQPSPMAPIGVASDRTNRAAASSRRRPAPELRAW